MRYCNRHVQGIISKLFTNCATRHVLIGQCLSFRGYREHGKRTVS